jgi:hypothetical protein
MFAPYFVSTGRITRNAMLTLLAGAVMNSPGFAGTVERAADEIETSAEMAPATTNQAAHKTGRVARAIFTTAIVDREPIDTLETFSTDTSRIFFFTDLRGLDGQIVTHRWEHNGQIMAEITFKVGSGARWRVYSSKNLLPEWTGTWQVVVNNENGETLHTSTFEYIAETMPAVE